MTPGTTDTSDNRETLRCDDGGKFFWVPTRSSAVHHARLEASAMDHSTGSSGAGSCSMCLEKRSSRAWSAATSVTASRKSPAPATAISRPRQVFVAEVRDCASCPFGRRLASPFFVHDHAVERAVEDEAGKRGARLRLDAALEAVEDGHVAGLQVRSAVRRDEGQHHVRESGLHPAQSMRVGLLQSRAVELFQAFGRLLVAQAHPKQ